MTWSVQSVSNGCFGRTTIAHHYFLLYYYEADEVRIITYTYMKHSDRNTSPTSNIGEAKRSKPYETVSQNWLHAPTNNSSSTASPDNATNHSFISTMKNIRAEHLEQLRDELESLSHDSSAHTDLELDSYLKFQKNVSSAAKALVASTDWKRRNPVNIADVSCFYRAPPGGRSEPPGCLVCLEDMKGNVARDVEGRPIIRMMGMVFGSEEELKQQIAYALQRAACYRLPHHRPGEVCFVTEVWDRETNSLSPTFRFPDAAVRSLFDFMKYYYPGSQFSVLHFCGVPSFVAGFFKMVKPFLGEEMFGRLKFKSNYVHLKRDGHVTPDNLLPHWDKEGAFEFDLDQYVEWREHNKKKCEI